LEPEFGGIVPGLACELVVRGVVCGLVACSGERPCAVLPVAVLFWVADCAHTRPAARVMQAAATVPKRLKDLLITNSPGSVLNNRMPLG
jgi:hypothetical protein